MKYYFTADLHLGHANIIKYSYRPFKTVEQMDKVLIQNWNDRVKPDDIVFVIGDFCYHNAKSFHSYKKMLNGQIVFVQGNHDITNHVKTKIQYIGLYMASRPILLVHDPAEAFGTENLVLCGHVHQHWQFNRFYNYGIEGGELGYYDCCNVGVDVWDYRPIDIQEILKEYVKFIKREDVK